MHFAKTAVLLVSLSVASLAMPQNVTPEAACAGFPAGALKCLSDVSFVVCTGPGGSIEQFVAAGTSCIQGIYGQKIDSIQGTVATATRAFTQLDPNGGVVKPTRRAVVF